MGDSFVHIPSVAPNEKEMTKKEEKKLKKEEMLVDKETMSEGKSEQTTYVYEEAIKATREYFGGDDLAAKVWASKYAQRFLVISTKTTICTAVLL
jgi:hypothetical protein